VPAFVFSLSAFECQSINYPDGSSITFCDEYFVVHSTDLPGGGCAGPEYDCVGFFNYPL
jgi:hypothetical protein